MSRMVELFNTRYTLWLNIGNYLLMVKDNAYLHSINLSFDEVAQEPDTGIIIRYGLPVATVDFNRGSIAGRTEPRPRLHKDRILPKFYVNVQYLTYS